MNPRRIKYVGYVVLIAAPLILFAPVVFTGKALFWGTPALQFVPWRDFAWNILKGGNLPLWNPLLGMGAPLIANYQSAVFYPPNWLLFILAALGGTGWLAWGQGILVVLHLIWAGIGMARLARQFGQSRLAQIVVGLAFSLCGYMVARAGFLTINAAAAWFPWVILFSSGLVGDRFQSGISISRNRSLILIAISIAFLLLAGHAQTAWYTLLFTLIWVGYWSWVKDDKRDRVLLGKYRPSHRLMQMVSAWLLLGAALGIAIGITALQLLPTLEYLVESQRSAAVDFESAMTYSYWPWRILTLFAPDLYGNPAQGDYWGYANYWEDALYIGVLPLIMVFAAVVNWIASHRRSDQNAHLPDKRVAHYQTKRKQAVGLLVAIILVAFVLALGNNTPLFSWLYQYVPTFDMFNAPTRISIWIIFSLALLAGYGVDSWRKPRGRGLYWVRLGTAGAAAIIIGSGLAWLFLDQIAAEGLRSPTFVRATALAGFWILGTGILTLTAPEYSLNTQTGSSIKGTRIKYWTLAVAGFVALDLICAGWGLNPGIDQVFYTMGNPAAENLRQQLAGNRLFLFSDAEKELKFDTYFRFDTFSPDQDWQTLRKVFLPNLTMLDDLLSANNFDPILPARYTTWINTLPTLDHEIQDTWLNQMAVTVVENISLHEQEGVVYKQIGDEEQLHVRWVPCGQIVDDSEAALSLMKSGSFDLDKYVIVEAKGKAPTDICQPSISGWIVDRENSKNPNQVTIQIDAESDGWLVDSEIWYPGWQAYIDDQPAASYPANYLFRTIEIPAGKHTVVWEYRPTSFRIGLVVTLSSVLGLLIFVCVYHNRKSNLIDHS